MGWSIEDKETRLRKLFDQLDSPYLPESGMRRELVTKLARKLTTSELCNLCVIIESSQAVCNYKPKGT